MLSGKHGRLINLFYSTKKVLITGHSGFKGNWLTYLLDFFGAKIIGVSLPIDETNILFKSNPVNNRVKHYFGNIVNFDFINDVISSEKPDLIFHLAAQPLVKESYYNPLNTYQVNFNGTLNILESIRLNGLNSQFINITTDKVYENKDWIWPYREIDNLNGFDPYSNSKSCSELVTSSYKRSFFSKNLISTFRAGNVVGGGDFSKDRLIPDCVKSIIENQPFELRFPNSTRPYQHVIEPIFGYVYAPICIEQNPNLEGSYNIGPNSNEVITNKELVSLFFKTWGIKKEIISVNKSTNLHEARLLKLDNSKLHLAFNLKPLLNIRETVDFTVNWYKAYANNLDLGKIMDEQTKLYLEKVLPSL